MADAETVLEGTHLTRTFEDGGEEALPIRRRYEVNAPSVEWGHLSFAALAHTADDVVEDFVFA